MGELTFDFKSWFLDKLTERSSLFSLILSKSSGEKYLPGPGEILLGVFNQFTIEAKFELSEYALKSLCTFAGSFGS